MQTKKLVVIVDKCINLNVKVNTSTFVYFALDNKDYNTSI